MGYFRSHFELFSLFLAQLSLFQEPIRCTILRLKKTDRLNFSEISAKFHLSNFAGSEECHRVRI